MDWVEVSDFRLALPSEDDIIMCVRHALRSDFENIIAAVHDHTFTYIYIHILFVYEFTYKMYMCIYIYIRACIARQAPAQLNQGSPRPSGVSTDNKLGLP